MNENIKIKSLSRVNFLNVLFTGIIFTLVIGFFVGKLYYDSYEKSVSELEAKYIKENKALVKNEVQRVIKRIKEFNHLLHVTSEKHLEQKVELVSNSLINHLSFDKSLTPSTAVRSYEKYLDGFHWDDTFGYFYIFDQSGHVLYHGYNKSFQGRNIKQAFAQSVKFKALVSRALDTQKDVFGSYNWIKAEDDKNLYEKFVYIKALKEQGLYVAAGIYKDDIKGKVQKQIINNLEHERFGANDYGYFWIHDLNYKMILHPVHKELYQTDLREFKTYDGQFFFQEANKIAQNEGAGFISYLWDRPVSKLKDEKISFIYLIEDWDMVIGSGFYMSELYAILEREKRSLKEAILNNVFYIFLTLLLVMLFSLLVAWFVSKRIQRIEKKQKDDFNLLSQYKLILDQSTMVSKTKLDGTITYVNKSFEEVSGFKRSQLIGNSHKMVRNPDTPKRQFKHLWTTISKGQTWKGVIKNRHKKGKSIYVKTTIAPIKNSQGRIIEYISAGHDITELIENKSKLQDVFKTDALTGLGNRVSLMNRLSKDHKGVLCLININGFKYINEGHGHVIGDRVLKELAKRMFEYFSEDDFRLYRVPADTFAIYTSRRSESVMIEKIKNFLKGPAKKAYQIGSESIAATYVSGLASNKQRLYTYADVALKEAKERKVKLLAFEESMSDLEQVKKDLYWVEKLQVAIAEGQIHPYFQPIYNFKTKKVEKYECLMRLVENGEVIFPGEFLSIAKRANLYPDLTYRMVSKAITKFSTSQAEFSINLSIEDLMNEDLTNYIYNLADRHQLFDRMVLEIVESEEISDSQAISDVITSFKEKGSKIAIDDFGSGYSNYDYLISIQADYVKIDGSIIKRLCEDERAQEIVRSIVSFCEKYNMKSVAEFVSSKEIATLAEELGVDYAQGFYYGKAEAELLE